MQSKVHSAKARKSLSPLDLAAELRSLRKCPVERVPDGWKPRAQWQREWKVSESVANKLLRAGVDAGRLQMRKFRVNTPRGAYNTPHYRPTT